MELKLTPKKTERGWCLRDKTGETVVNAEGFTAWFKSRDAAVKAAPKARHDTVNDWIVI